MVADTGLMYVLKDPWTHAMLKMLHMAMTLVPACSKTSTQQQKHDTPCNTQLLAQAAASIQYAMLRLIYCNITDANCKHERLQKVSKKRKKSLCH